MGAFAVKDDAHWARLAQWGRMQADRRHRSRPQNAVDLAFSGTGSATGARITGAQVGHYDYNPAARGSINVIEGTNAITKRQTNKIASSGNRGRTVSSTCTLPMAQEP
jgi:hypothetical protein